MLCHYLASVPQVIMICDCVNKSEDSFKSKGCAQFFSDHLYLQICQMFPPMWICLIRNQSSTHFSTLPVFIKRFKEDDHWCYGGTAECLSCRCCCCLCKVVNRGAVSGSISKLIIDYSFAANGRHPGQYEVLQHSAGRPQGRWCRSLCDCFISYVVLLPLWAAGSWFGLTC